jgi:hypothetical protein
METAPKDGRLVWAFLYDSGIKLVRWSSALHDEAWVEANDPDNDWVPEFWAPLEAIQLPNGIRIEDRHGGGVRLREYTFAE